MGGKESKLNPRDVSEFSRQTEFNEKEIEDWYKSFIKDYPDGYLTVQQFKKVYRNFYPTGDANLFAENAFGIFDRNNDGRLNFKEFITGMSIASHGNYENKLKWIFKLYDKNENGYISIDEMKAIVKSIYQVSKGRVNDAMVQRHVNAIFEKANGNVYGNLTLNDFIRLAKYDPTVSSVMTGSCNMGGPDPTRM